MNPLIGRNRDTLGPRFPPMSDAYDFDLRKEAFRAAKELGFKKGTLTEGVYAWVGLSLTLLALSAGVQTVLIAVSI
jgi:purine-nucleoside phosphorylase